ncbi:MAG: amino acid ABC transporter substrate-binding protein [Rhodospirillales bacterium]|nr:amino acid ABC transporter substrate-binding protein [Rhodospirillales bacterium]
MIKRLGVLVACLFAFAVAPAGAAELYGTLKKVKEKGEIVMGHREASVPFAYIGPDGKPIGYSIDLCNKIIDKVKNELKMPDLKVKQVPVTPQTRIPLLANGTIDIECGSTTNNLTRTQQVDFLAVTYITGTKLAVKKGSGIKEIEDLKGKAIGLALGTTNEKAIKTVAEQLKIDLKYHMVKDHPQGWLALETGRVDAYATDDVLLYGLISKSKDPSKYEVVGRFLSYDPYGIMVRRDDSAIRLLGNTVLADLMRSGEMQKIYDKWFNPGPTNIKMPISADLKKAYEIQALPY